MGNVVDIDLGDLYKKAFGKPTDAFNPKLDNVSGDMFPTRIGWGASGSPYYATDLVVGTEYFMPVTVSFTDGQGKINGLIGSDAGPLVSWDLPFPIISITGRKTMIRTPLTERRGGVLELINLKGYDITIKGFMIAGTNDYPEDLVTTMRNLYEKNVAINIKSPLTDVFLLRPDSKGNDLVVIEELILPGLKGVKNVVPYELKLVSDEIFNLIDIS